MFVAVGVNAAPWLTAGSKAACLSGSGRTRPPTASSGFSIARRQTPLVESTLISTHSVVPAQSVSVRRRRVFVFPIVSPRPSLRPLAFSAAIC